MVTFKINALEGIGKIKYSLTAINTSDGTREEVVTEGNSNIITWKPSKKGSYRIYYSVKDVSLLYRSLEMKVSVN